MLSGQMELPAPDPAEPRLLSDIVPTLRPDLSIVVKPDSSGLFDVGQRGAAQTFTLYDFEVSIARMCNGRRTVSELIEAAARIGIPVTLDSFRKFVRQLNAYGFLLAPDEVPAPVEEDPTWTPRAEWKPEVREHFQSALRTFRKGRLTESRGYLEALLQIQPEVSEAIELLARVEERIALGEGEPMPTFVELHGAPAELAPAPEASGATARSGASGVSGAPEGSSLSDAPAIERGPPLTDEPTAEELKAIRRPRWPVFAAVGVAFVAISGVMAVPVPCVATASAELVPANEPAVVKAGREAKIAELVAPVGEWVEKDAVLLRFDDGPLKEKLLSIERELSSIDRRLVRLKRKDNSSAARRARSVLAKKERELKRLVSLRDRVAARSQKQAATRRLLVKTEKKLRSKESEVESARRTVLRTGAAQEIEALATQRKELEAKKAEIAAGFESLAVLAPSDGVFKSDRRAGDVLKADDVVGELHDDRLLRARITLPSSGAEQVASGQAVSIQLPDHPGKIIQTTLAAASGTNGTVRTAEAAVDNEARALPPRATGVAEISCGSRPLLRRVLGD